MEECVTLRLEEDMVRFTPDGRISVIDAIGALSEDGCPVCIWEDLQRHHPELGELCDGYTFDGEKSAPVADGRNWEFIQTLLLDRLIDGDL